MWTFGVDDVVMPIGLQQPPVGSVVALVGSDPVSALEDCEKIREQIDEHVLRAAGSGQRAAGDNRWAPRDVQV
jgi:hypothetical protein